MFVLSENFIKANCFGIHIPYAYLYASFSRVQLFSPEYDGFRQPKRLQNRVLLYFNCFVHDDETIDLKRIHQETGI